MNTKISGSELRELQKGARSITIVQQYEMPAVTFFTPHFPRSRVTVLTIIHELPEGEGAGYLVAREPDTASS